MKKTLFSFAVLSILAMTNAVQAETYVATKEYVDSGLSAVYTRVKNRDAALQNNIDALAGVVGTEATDEEPATGLVKRIDDVSAAMDGLRNEMAYNGDGTGVLVTDSRTVGISGLTPSTGTNNRMYVFKNNIATELDVADTWVVGANSGTDTTPGNGD